MDLISRRNSILRCVTDFKEFLIEPVCNAQEATTFFKKLPALITNLMRHTDKFCNEEKLTKEQNFIVVTYLMQYCSVYEIYKNVYLKKSKEKELILEVHRCLCKQLTLLLNTTDVIFDNQKCDVTVGSFLNLVDAALDKTYEIDVTKGKDLAQSELNTLSSIIEEILCLSMSVAQVAFGEDNKIIFAGCRSVLNAVESLKIEISQENPNIPMSNLLVDTCNDTLCALEARVNTAVLRLCLNVFSDYNKPIKELYNSCLYLDKSEDDVSAPFISVFDLHMDRIFQTGLFSIASSTIGLRVADIKTVIYNLEFLEGELVPTFLAMAEDPLECRKQFAKVLKNAWSTQIKFMRKAVHCIIEPSAYCKLIYEELKEKVDELWLHISLGNNTQISMIDPFLYYTKELCCMFRQCMDSFNSDMTNGITKQLEMVCKVLNELVAARDLLLKEKVEVLDAVANKRIFKRCQVLTVTIKRLWLSTSNNSQTNQHSNTNVNANVQNQTIIKSSSHLESDKESDPILQGIIMKSKQIVKDRSICHLNYTSFTFNQTRKECKVKQSKEEKLTHLRKTINLREYSYRQSKFVEDIIIQPFASLSCVEKLFPYTFAGMNENIHQNVVTPLLCTVKQVSDRLKKSEDF